MKIVSSTKRLNALVRPAKRKGLKVGFVPTMGDLHQGHIALLRRCRKENDLVVLSVFVNPRQFGPTEDYRAYPRDKKKDCMLAKIENVDIIFYPSERQMYAGRYLTEIKVNKLSETMCGSSRPGHFTGVATVVAKLLNIVEPDVLYLGQKDAQQCVVIKQMVRDLNFSVRIATVPTVREKDGLALSSRNKYLTKKQREDATILFRSLTTAKKTIQKGERRPQTVLKLIKGMISSTSGQVDYCVCVDAEKLLPKRVIEGKILLALAVRFGKARLIDNVVILIP